MAIKRIVIVVLLLTLLPAITFAQDQPVTYRYAPVDQAVGDLDSLSTSMRHVQAGLGVDGYQSRLYRVEPTGPLNFNTPPSSHPAYVRLSPGVVAQVDRLDYVVKRGRKGRAYNVAPQSDGEYLEMVPPNTVFMLTPIDMNSETLPYAGIDYRVNARVDTQLDLRVQPQTSHRFRRAQ